MRKTWPDLFSQMDHKEQRTQKKCVMRAGNISSTCVSNLVWGDIEGVSPQMAMPHMGSDGAGTTGFPSSRQGC